ncbi:MAG: high frequency lysogenization protein HflD [Gammaproteobacteria bacterium]|nr:high frequency lysogenization protein HflD [Gammaproteobacteria bacterium]
MKYSLDDRITALAGVFLAAKLVQSLAHTGQADEKELEMLLSSVLNDVPDNVLDVYQGDLQNIRAGLIAIQEQLGLQGKRDTEATKYVMGMLFLERKLSKSSAMMAALGNGIEQIRRQMDHFPLLHDNVVANFAGIYSDNLSTLSFRIMVSGDPNQLANPDVANRIRAVLLAGIRSAVLWHQTGGRRWQLLFQRSKIVNQSLQMLRSITH